MKETLSIQQRPKSLSCLLSPGTASMALKNTTNLPASKKRQLSEDHLETKNEKWVQLASTVLTKIKKSHSMAGEKFNDLHIDVAKGVLKQQFLIISVLQSPLLQKKKCLKVQDSNQ